MFFLDMKTVIFSHIVTDVVCMVVMLLLWHRNRKRFAGLSFWVGDYVLQVVAVILIILRGSIPDFISMAVSNTLVVAGALAMYMGLQRFVGKRGAQVHNYGLLAVFFLVLTYFVLIDPDLTARTITISFGIFILTFQCMWLLLRRVAPGMRPITYGLGLVFLGYCLVSIFRVIVILAGPELSNDFFKSGIMETLLVLTYQMLFIIQTYGLVLIVIRRLLIEVMTQEEKFAKAFNSSPYAINLTRLSDGRIIEVNKGFVDVSGYACTEAYGKTIAELRLWDREEDRLSALNELSKSGKIHEAEFQFRKKSGEVVTGLLSAEIITIDNQRCVLSSINDITKRKQAEEALQQAHDELEHRVAMRTKELMRANEELRSEITERKRAEQALQKSERKFRELVEDINEVIYSVDAKGIINYISPAVKRILGDEPKNIIGRDFLDFVHPEDRLRLLDKFQKVLSGQSGPIEYRVLSKTGEYRWIRSSSKPIYDDSRLIGLRGVFSDITEEKRLRGDLQQAQKMEAIGTLAGGIAHEFNNILAIILGNTELAIDDVPEWNPAKYCLEEVRTASLRAKGVVQQILSFARKTPTTRKPIKISTIIKKSLKLIRVTIPASIQIRQEILCDSEMIFANPTEIIQILVNLCSNSVHAMEEETGILEVRLETTILNDRFAAQYEGLTAGAYVKLTVKDTGKGIDPKIINRIFDPYFTTKDVDKGLGMGLAVVIGIVKQHDGAIKFMSEVGKGTTAEVLFPVTEVQAETEVEESDDLPSGTERILFVDDEVSLVKIAKQILERQGYEVVGKTSSTEALKLFQEESDKFDLIITDMAMPDMPGDHLSRELVKIRPNIPIILCTGHSDRIDEEKAKDLGISAYAMKPLDKKGLTKMVREILDKTKS